MVLPLPVHVVCVNLQLTAVGGPKKQIKMFTYICRMCTAYNVVGILLYLDYPEHVARLRDPKNWRRRNQIKVSATAGTAQPQHSTTTAQHSTAAVAGTYHLKTPIGSPRGFTKRGRHTLDAADETLLSKLGKQRLGRGGAPCVVFHVSLRRLRITCPAAD